MDAGSLTLTVSNALAGIPDCSKISITNRATNGTKTVQLTASTTGVIHNVTDVVTCTLSAADLNKLKEDTTIATATTNSYLLVAAGSNIRDAAGAAVNC